MCARKNESRRKTFSNKTLGARVRRRQIRIQSAFPSIRTMGHLEHPNAVVIALVLSLRYVSVL